MRLKAVRDLSQKSDTELFGELERGLRLCHENAQRTLGDVVAMADLKRHRAATILQGIATEEAAKALILLDGVRCPRNKSDLHSRQLAYFSNHLSKGIYTSVCEIRPRSFADVCAWVERERKEFYCDGPTGSEWIYTNQITTSREQAMYVDYVFAEGKYWWHDPATSETDHFQDWGLRPSSVVQLTAALYNAGFFSASALALVAEIWRPIRVDAELSIHDLRRLNVATLESLDRNGLLTETNQETLDHIASAWIFPLYPLDLRIEPNKIEVEATRGDFPEY